MKATFTAVVGKISVHALKRKAVIVIAAKRAERCPAGYHVARAACQVALGGVLLVDFGVLDDGLGFSLTLGMSSM